MSKHALLDPTRTGRQAADPENRLRHLVTGQDGAIHQIVRAYQTYRAGADFRYGARPLKRAIERLLVQPLSNLIATGQIQRRGLHPRDPQWRLTHSNESKLQW